MPILPLQQFEADVEEDRKTYARLKTPDTLVVRFGVMKMVGEFPNHAGVKPGCGSKLVVRTHRGTELGEMLTSTCPNSGCSKSVSRQEMLQYIENSGGRDYPFSTQGRVLRLATAEDLNEQARLDGMKREMVMTARQLVGELGMDIKVVEAEPLLDGDRLTFYFNSENRVDFRDLVGRLATKFRARIEMRQIGARDEARLTADYERCGQHCCCKQFLKVLKPISMRSAKVQKATLDPLKISGRCGRLMCCLRYEDETYEDLRKRLPKKKIRVGTPEGPGIVMDSQILTQLVLVRLEADDKDIAVPVEDLSDPAEWDAKKAKEREAAEAARAAKPAAPPGPPARDPGAGGRRGDRRGGERRPQAPASTQPPHSQAQSPSHGAPGAPGGHAGPQPQRHRPDNRARPPRPDAPQEQGSPRGMHGDPTDGSAPQSGPPGEQGRGPGEGGRRRRRRRRRGGGGGGGGGTEQSGPSGGSGGDPGPSGGGDD